MKGIMEEKKWGEECRYENSFPLKFNGTCTLANSLYQRSLLLGSQVCILNQLFTLTVEAVGTSEMSASFYETT
jgi:hypothetical protein